jgi:hypothetical protein
MPSPAQGLSFSGLPDGLTNVKIKVVGIDPTSSANRLDASTLALSVGSDRVYIDGLPDSGAGAVSGSTTTITVSYFGAPPTAGDVITYDGADYKCTEAEQEYAVGELVKGTATYVSIPSEE